MKYKTPGIYVIGKILKKEAMDIKSSLDQPWLEEFRASEAWFGKWRLTHDTREKQIPGEYLVVSKATVES